jgi:predicted nucleotidyltransferase
VWLYGSRARGEPTHDESDVDLLVITGDRKRDQQRVSRLLYDAAIGEGGEPDFFIAQVWEPEWLANRRAIGSFFLREVERDKIVLYE